MSTLIPHAIVDRAKNKLQTFYDKLQVSDAGEDFYTLIQSCLDIFFVRYTKDMGWAGAYEACDPKPMEDHQAISIIKAKVVPWLRMAKQYIKPSSKCWQDFQVMHNLFEVWFGKDVPPLSEPPDKDVQPLSEPPEKSVRNRKIYAVDNFDANEIKIESINTAIATLQQQMSQLPGINQRLLALEAKFTENAKTPRRRLGTFPGGDPFSNADSSDPRSDMHQQASIDTLLQKISKLENDFKCL